MNPNDRKIWFPAKRYGYGWGPPVCWQGWLFLVSWLVGLYAGVYFLRPDRHPVLFFVHLAVFISVLLLVCRLKGEKTGWRWGGKE